MESSISSELQEKGQERRVWIEMRKKGSRKVFRLSYQTCARAFTGRRNSHSGRGEDFLTGQPDFFTETAVTPERKVEKWFPRWEINRHAEG